MLYLYLCFSKNVTRYDHNEKQNMLRLFFRNLFIKLQNSTTSTGELYDKKRIKI